MSPTLMTLTTPNLTLDTAGSLATITLNRPPVNSYNEELMLALGDAIDAAERDPAVRVIILASALERFFSAGADLKDFLAREPAENAGLVETAHEVLERMADSPKLFIAAINGHALGGGLEIALACDLRCGREADYQLGLPEIRVGLFPGNGGTQRLPRLIGASRALHLMLSGEPISLAEAVALGLVNRTFPADRFMEEVRAFAGKIAAYSATSIARIKQAVYGGLQLSLAEGLSLERRLIGPLFASEDVREGLSAFVEKRPPLFTGR
jgi:enoyl-CoA hydratase/carnithine racemase